jgi:hypothetical protein
MQHSAAAGKSSLTSLGLAWEQQGLARAFCSSALALAASAGAQERSTIELGAFTSVGFFDKALTLNTGYGIGGRVGAYLVHRIEAFQSYHRVQAQSVYKR